MTGRHFNDRAVYTCDDGYQIVGLEQVICKSNGQWSGSQPSCKQGTSSAQSRYYCGTPTIIPHAKHNGSSEQVVTNLSSSFCVSGVEKVHWKPLFRCITTWIQNCRISATQAIKGKAFKSPNASSITELLVGSDPISHVIQLTAVHQRTF